jgi:hypothetical protein
VQEDLGRWLLERVGTGIELRAPVEIDDDGVSAHCRAASTVATTSLT